MITLVQKKKKKKYRLKYEFKKFLVYFFVFLCFAIYIIKESINIYKQYQYEKTYEYKLLNIGYSKEETTKLINILPEEKLDTIVENEYDEIYYNIVNQKYYINKNYDKYIEYKTENPKTSYSDTIAIINVNANLGWYNNTKEANTKEDHLILVNSFNYLKEDYKRDDIIPVSLQYAYNGNNASQIVIEQFNSMRLAIAEELDVYLMINSSYISYEKQQTIYNNHKAISLKNADKNAARPGHSEHQTGLAIDISSLENKTVNDFINSEEYQWLINNCHTYGFILRYPSDKEHITGVSNEKTHFRYVGTEVATLIYKENITFDEYHAYYIAN